MTIHLSYEAVRIKNANGIGYVDVSSESTLTDIKTELTRTITVKAFSFNSAAVQTIITGEASKKIYIVAISFHNNETDAVDDAVVRLLDDTTYLYGDSNGCVYLPGRGGFWGLPMNNTTPYFILTTAKNFNMHTPTARRISGTVWYYIE